MITMGKNVGGGPGRTRTSNQSVMSGQADPKNSTNIGIFHRVRARSFASVHAVFVVNLWSIPKTLKPLSFLSSELALRVACVARPEFLI